MSRIFDALRQSEKEKQPGTESWPPLPQMFAPHRELDASDPSRRGIEPAQAGEEPQNLSSLASAESVSPAASHGKAVDRQTLQTSPTRLSSLCPENGAKPVSEIQRLLADILPDPNALFPAASPMEATTLETEDAVRAPSQAASPQISPSDLNVVSSASIQSPLIVALNHERELGAEKYRVLGARLSNIRLGANLKVLQVTSSVVGEGKTVTSVNLAMTLAKRFSQKVILVEGDLRKPAACALLGLSNRMGLGDWWQENNAPISDFMLRIGDTGMSILPAGNAVHPASVLQSPRLPEMLIELGRQFDWVIIDTPPLLPMADSNQWSRVADGTLLVVRKGAVSRATLKKAVESIDNPKLVGIVLNDASDYDRVNYGQYYTPRIVIDNAQRKAVSK